VRIGQFTSQYPYPDQYVPGEHSQYFCSGAERVVRNLSEGLSDRGHDVHVFTSGRPGETTVQNGVTIHRARSLGSVGTTEVAPGLLTAALDTELDIAHAHNSTPPGVVAGAAYARLRDTPFVITHHGGEAYVSHGGPLRRAGLWIYTRGVMELLFRSATAVAVPSDGYIETSRVLPAVRDRIEVIPNGVDPSAFEPSEGIEPSERIERTGESDPSTVADGGDGTCFCYVGALQQRKGVDVLLRAFARVAGDAGTADGTGADSVSLVVAGSGPDRDRLQRLAGELDVTDSVSFPGYVPEADKRTLLVAADCFVLPTARDGVEMYPLVLGEAAAAGTPLVCSDFPALRSVLAGRDCATLVPPRDEAALAEAMARLHENEDERARHAANARDFAAETSWSAVCEAYLELYRRAAPDGGTGP